MNNLFEYCLGFADVYVEDIFIYSRNLDKHLNNILAVLIHLRAEKLFAKLTNCSVSSAAPATPSTIDPRTLLALQLLQSGSEGYGEEVERAGQLLSRAAEDGCPEACLQIGDLLGSQGLAEVAVGYWKRAAARTEDPRIRQRLQQYMARERDISRQGRCSTTVGP